MRGEKKARLGLCYKAKRTLADFSSSVKKPLGKKQIDATKLFKIITTSKAQSRGWRLRKKVAYEQFTQNSYERDHIVKDRNESM